MKRLRVVLGSSVILAAITFAAQAADSITVSAFFDQTGPGGPYAKRGENGFNLALEEAKASGTLKPEIKIKRGDTGGNPQRAATLAGEAVNSESSIVVYGTSSAPALAMAPAMQQAKLPLVVVQAVTPKLLSIGNYVYTSSAFYRTFHELYAKFLASKGVKKLAVVYTGDAPSFNELGSQDYVAFGQKYGFDVELNEVAISTTDFTTITRKILSNQPDAIAFLLYGPQSATFINLLRQADYQGYVGANTVTDFLTAAGEQANGIYSPAPFAPPIGCEGGKKFAESYQKTYGAEADDIAANGYNAGRMVVRAIELANGMYTRESLKESMDKVLSEGINDTSTCTLSFEGHEVRIPGILVQIEGGKQVEVKLQ